MSFIFDSGLLTTSKEFLLKYCPTHNNKKYLCVDIEGDAIRYPYALVHEIGTENCSKLPELKFIEDGEINFNGELKTYQQDLMDEVVKNPYGIIISAPGTGKTVMGLWLINQLKLKTLILVNSAFLLRQWAEECSQFLGYTPGVIGDKEFTIKDITVATFQSARKDDKLNKLRNRFSLVIVDECHRVPADTFRYTLSNIEAFWKIGFTGTYHRKDGLEFLADFYLGNQKFINDYDDTMVPQIVVVRTGIDLPDSEDYVECLNNLEDDERLLNKIKEFVDKGTGRHQLILSFRLETVSKLAEMFPNAIVVTGNTKSEDRKDLNERVLKHKIIITTTLQEGVNIPNLDTLHLIHPNNNVPMLEQRIKRINRPVDGKKVPLVFDYWYKQGKCRGFSVYNQQMIRLAFYNREGYKVHVI